MAAISLRPAVCTECGAEAPPSHRFCGRCRNRHRPRHTSICPHCKRTFSNSKGATYCSKKCGRAVTSALEKTKANCPQCGREFWPWKDGKHGRKHCSPACAHASMRRPKRPKPEWDRNRMCAWCSVQFIAKAKRQKYCCDPHNDIAKSQRRKARLRNVGGELPSVWEIYERDKGRCALCRKRVGRSFRWPDQRTASLDHVIPISKGGRDEGTNVQLAHLGCNIKKQSRITTLF